MLDDMIADMESNKSPIVTELFLRGRKLNNLLVSVIILFQSAYNYKSKCNTLFYHENS